MSMDYYEYEQEAAIEEFLQEELRRISEGPVFSYLAMYGDAIEERVKRCLMQAQALSDNGYPGAALTRAASGIEVTIRFFLARPLVQGAFLSDEWAELLSEKLLRGRTAEDRELLPAILRNWKMDITSIKLSDGSQAWERIVKKVWPCRNNYVHKADDCSNEDALLAIECLKVLLCQVVEPIAKMLGFTREETGYWSVVNAKMFQELNPPRTYTRHDPFVQ